ncbi:MAG: phosphoglycerate kinase [Candidatus Nealsonbacteria bacterium]|nr:phosphoglycerate kinase [Candidatus Nealsonbacteria bacterium]
MSMKTVRDFDVANKRVLVRCDFNVPLSETGEILDDFRIKKTIPTIEYLLGKGAKIILMSHLGRPEGKVVEEFRLTPVQDKLTEYLDISVAKAPDCIGAEIEKWTKGMRSGETLLLENLRFYKEEEENDENFAKELSKLGDIYINDAFGASHRAHASIAGITKFLPSAGGLLLEKEIEVLTSLLKNPQKPLVAVIGGKKVEDKAGVVDKISKTADLVLVSGLIEKEIKEKSLEFKYPNKIIGPVDEIGGGKDVGPETIRLFREKIMQAKTVFWSGPLGKIEDEEFAGGTKALAQAIIESKAYSVAGGGETMEFVNKLGLGEKFSHLSTGGGAMLEFLSGKSLPGLEALE